MKVDEGRRFVRTAAVLAVFILFHLSPGVALTGEPAREYITFVETKGGLSLFTYFHDNYVEIFNIQEEIVWQGVLVAGNELAFTVVSVPEGVYKCVSPGGLLFGVHSGQPPAGGVGGGDSNAGRGYDNGPLTVLCTVWEGDPNLYHTTYNGKEITLQGVARGLVTGVHYTYEWDYGDGNPPATGTVTDPFAIEARHTYPDFPSGTAFQATLTVRGDDGSEAADTFPVVITDATLNIKINIAISEGLWYLHKAMIRGTSEWVAGFPVDWGYFPVYSVHSGYPYVGYVAAVMETFHQQGHWIVGNTAEDPYIDTVQRGLNWLLRQSESTGISQQQAGNPDTNGNGIGLNCYSNSNYAPGHHYNAYIYETAMALLAFATSGAPDEIAPVVGRSDVDGRGYLDIIQDMADFLFYAQDESGSGRGGWRYQANYSSSDNSVTQWPALALFAAEENFKDEFQSPLIVIPVWVKDEARDYWIPSSQNDTDGGFGYDWNGGRRNVGLTGAGLIELAWLDIEMGGPQEWRVIKAIDFIGGRWDLTGGQWNNVDYNKGNYYAMYAVMKAARLSDPWIPEFKPGVDWYNDYSSWLIDEQRSDGSWPDTTLSSWGPCGPEINTAWAISILLPTVIKPKPVAVLSASPNPTDVNIPILFDGSKSYDTNTPPLDIVKYEFDFGNSDTYVETVDYAPDGKFDGKTLYTYTVYDIYTSELIVTNADDPPRSSTPVQLEIKIVPPDHPPTAVITILSGAWISTQPGIDYEAYSGAEIAFDGSESYDIDEIYGDYITKWEWDFTAPTTFDPVDAEGMLAYYTWTHSSSLPETYDLGLRVTDNGDPNWTPPGPLQGYEFATILIHPNAPPVANAGPDQILEQTDAAGTPVVLDGSESYDPNNDPLDYEWTWDQGSAQGVAPIVHLPLGKTIITLVVYDGKVYSDPDTIEVTVEDTTPPVVKAQADVTVEQASAAGTEVTLSATVTDICDADVDVTWSYGPIFTFPLGTTEVTVTGTDDSGNVGSDKVYVHVVDTTPPDVTAQEDVTVEQASAAGTEVTLSATVTDICDADVDVTWSHGPTCTFPLGTTEVTVTGTDDSGNVGSDVVYVNVVDSTPPDVTAQADVTVEQASAAGTEVTLSATATDICDADVELTWSHGPTFTFPLGTTEVTVTGTDDSGNVGSDIVYVHVVDTTPPVITPLQTDHVLWPPNHKYHTITIADCVESVSDICDVSVTISDIVIERVSSDEPEDVRGNGDGKTMDDIVIVNSQKVELRAERQGKGNGRVYTIHFQVTDASGNTQTGFCKVCVPHDKSGDPAVDDGPQAGYTVYYP